MILLINIRRAELSRRVVRTALAGVFVLFLVLPGTAWAATGLDGTAMSWPWALPFAGLLLSIAAGPLLFPRLWHAHYGKIAALWSDRKSVV